MPMVDLIELVCQHSRPYMFCSVRLTEFPVMDFCPVEYRQAHKGETSMEQRFFSRDDVVSFLAERDLFGWEVQSYEIESRWNQAEEMKIVLCRMEK